MNFLIVEAKPAARDLLIGRLFPQGVNLYHVENLERARRLMGTLRFPMMLLDIDAEPLAALEFLRQQAAEPFKPVRLLLSSITDRNEIIPYVGTGIAGFILKPFSAENGLPRLLSLLQSLDGEENRRSYHRVSPQPDSDETKAYFRLPSDAKVRTATLLNLSAGGLALHCHEPLPEGELKQGDPLSKVQIRLDKHDLFYSGVVAFRKGPVFALALRDCAEDAMFALSRYIFNRLAETV